MHKQKACDSVCDLRCCEAQIALAGQMPVAPLTARFKRDRAKALGLDGSQPDNWFSTNLCKRSNEQSVISPMSITQ